jgi:hypothetical protein
VTATAEAFPPADKVLMFTTAVVELAVAQALLIINAL